MSSSDSEEFYDAEDESTSGRNSRKTITTITSSNGKKMTRCGSEPCIKQTDEKVETPKITSNSKNNLMENDTNQKEFKIPPNPQCIQQTRKKLNDLRKHIEVDDDEGNEANIFIDNSRASSLNEVYATSSALGYTGASAVGLSQPFRIVEQDNVSLQSMSSLGKIGRILSGNTSYGPNAKNKKTQSMSTISQSSKDSTSDSKSWKDDTQLRIRRLEADQISQLSRHSSPSALQEPDVIASTKNGNNFKREQFEKVPVAPPRKKKKSGQIPNSTSTPPLSKQSSLKSNSSLLSSPESTVESITRDLENSLSVASPVKIKEEKSQRKSSLLSRHKSENNSRSNTIKSQVHEDITLFDFRSIQDFENLNLRSAVRGKYVVKPQDDVKSRANGPSFDKLRKDGTLTECSLSTAFVNSNGLGYSSLGSHRLAVNNNKNSSQRRRSAGDEDLVRQMNMYVRVRTDSGKQLSDKEILDQVTVLNLDTGERMPLSVAENKIPQCINPLSLHIMRLTSEYVSTTSIEKEKESDDESIITKQFSVTQGDDLEEVGGVKRKTAKLKRFLGTTVKRTMDKAKSIAQEVSHARHKEDAMDLIDEVNPNDSTVKLKSSNSHKGPYEFENTSYVQELSCAESEDKITCGHFGPIWCMKFSVCGRLLATAGQDRLLRVWIVKEAYSHFQAMRNKYDSHKVSPTPSQESLSSGAHHFNLHPHMDEDFNAENDEINKHIFMKRPFCMYSGHTSDLLDVSWSKNYFLLSSSMDKTVRLWHITRNECLCCFQHIDFVTAIVFHPKDDRYFLSGSLDGKLRLWNIPDKKVAVWNEVDGPSKLITTANFCQNGKFAVVGSYDGRCIFYNIDQLKYHTQIDVRSTRGRNSTGRKICGIEPMPGEDRVLVTSNDSRIRLYDLRSGCNLSCKYKGFVNVSSHIKASFSHDGKYIVSGSENRDVYIWKTHHDYSKFSSARRDRNDYWEAIKAHNAVVTCAVFAPDPNSLIKMVEDRLESVREKSWPHEDPTGADLIKTAVEEVQDPLVEQHTKGCGGYVLVSADFNGCIKVFINKQKPKHSSLPASAMA